MTKLSQIVWLAVAIASISVSAALSSSTAAENSSSSANAKAVEDKVNALLSQMTPEEKLGQIVQVDSGALVDKGDVAKYFLGSVLSGGSSDPPNHDNTGKAWANYYNEFQKQALKTRLKIPIIYGVDAVHGHSNIDGAVIFPHNIGLGCTRNADLIERASRVTAEEMAGTGTNWAFAPCIAVARNPRWGRTYESFGESPDVVAPLGAASVRGLQGKSLADPTSVVACAKHYLADGGTTNGKDQGNTECDEATLRKIYLPGYQEAVKAGVGTIMVSFSSWNGKKMHGNKYLLTEVLKGELGFPGFLISDWAAIDQLSSDYKNDIEQSINAGLDMIMIPYPPGQKNNYVEFLKDLKELVDEGRVPQSRIDDAVRRILRVKYQTRLFEQPLADPAYLDKIGSAEHRAVARECVRQSLVLLKNENHALPLKKDIKHLHVMGKGADDIGIQCGGWTIDWQGKPGMVTHGGTTILSALRKVVPDASRITFSADDSGGEGADAVLVVIGEMPYAEGPGDRKDLALSQSDLDLVEKAKKLGVPVITMLLSGRPMILGKALDHSDAFVAAWLPGTEGDGVADVLFGAYKPTGKLSQTWPASMDQVPLHAGDANADKALFQYGYGLSY
ncbi:MAG TPA: glycoside hydrolase family 3 N-terminal domain-containing protein [Pirellulales bacterium]|jgi:beta-glucosidase|nr:glycoside hydrolase family 3 N-terminal domain-containing protein [Pirellulales bacterium]